MKRCSIALALGLVLSLASPAGAADGGSAGLPSPAIYVGIFGGYNLVLDAWDLHDDPDGGEAPDSSVVFGGRVGLQITSYLGLEFGVSLLPLTAGALDGLAVGYHGDALISPFSGDWSPHLLLGGGAYQAASGDLGADADWEIHYGLGLRGMLTRWLALRVDARHIFTDSSEAGLANLVELTLGVDFFVWGADAGPPPDSDGDGINDEEDACPSVRGHVTAHGCPDSDGDGVKDGADRCIDKPGPPVHDGCPDTDGDGLPDDLDKCVDEVGPADHSGCPPEPIDIDGDGVSDELDACPHEHGPPENGGCPDRDDDGIVDRDDKCPDQAGVPEEQGCLPKAIAERFSGAIKGIYFKVGSAKIRNRSYKLLNDAAKILAQYEGLKIEVSGHTDNRGRKANNMKLSQARAESVRDYLIKKGIAAERLTAVGFGPDKPVADNKTKKGRAQNRRIEFKIAAQ